MNLIMNVHTWFNKKKSLINNNKFLRFTKWLAIVKAFGAWHLIDYALSSLSSNVTDELLLLLLLLLCM